VCPRSLRAHSTPTIRSFDDYVQEREELALLFREIAKVAGEHRQKKGTLQVINGASGVTASVAGAIALALSPSTFGLSVPAAAVMTTVIVSHSIAAASLTSSVASYGFGREGDEDIARRLRNLQCVMDSVERKDAEINKLMSNLERDNVQPVVKACQQLRSSHVHREMDKEKPPVHVDLPLSVMKTHGIFLGTHSMLEGVKKVQEEEELEIVLMETANALDEETSTIRTLRNQFKYLSCVPGEQELPRGRLTCIDRGGGPSRIMVATFLDGKEEKTLKSDNSKVILLPEGATEVKVHFEFNGGNTIKKVDRGDPKQQWIMTERGQHQVDVFDFDCGDGVDAVFMVQWTLTRTFVSKAWDFGRHPWATPRAWEWWENADTECKELVPGLEARLANRSKIYEPTDPCGMDMLTCGSCLMSSDVVAAEA